MAEIGLLQFAHVARTVAEVAAPPYRTPFSKHTFTQPSLLAILCLMCYEDWTYRETETRLREHAELRAALGIVRVSKTKRNLSARAPGRSPATQQRQALLLGVTYNLYRLRFPLFLLLCP